MRRWPRGSRPRRSCRRGGPLVGDRQDQRKTAALAGRARQLELAAEQRRDLAADRQAQARAAVHAAGGTVGLLEGVEDDALLVGRDADAGVADLEGDRLVAAWRHA